MIWNICTPSSPKSCPPAAKSFSPPLVPACFRHFVTVRTRFVLSGLRNACASFYTRDSGQYVLHRIVKVNADGTYTLRGDHQIVNEQGVRPDQIIGVVKGFWRGGRYIACDGPLYRLYCRVWWLLYPVRYVVLRGRGAASRLRRRFH